VPVLDPVFLSYAQTGEDVVLWRALGSVEAGRYVEIGANHPSEMSVTRGFYERGWSGITVEPVPAFAEMHLAERPRDTLVQAAITDADVPTVTLHEISGTGLSTLVDEVSDRHDAAGWEHQDIEVAARRLDDVLAEHLTPQDAIHFMTVDVEGAEARVLASIDLGVWRPWVLVVEATSPLSASQTHRDWEDAVLAAGYQFCLFDGLSRFYVADEHAAELAEKLSYPACPHDNYDTRAARDLRTERAELLGEVLRWRALALEGWAQRAAGGATSEEAEAIRRELEAMRSTISWRVTAPLRALRGRASR
jgi:FkbM family methyltransferase